MMKGIDVSKWQGKIDWHKVKKDGVQFVMIRVSHGVQADAMFVPNIEGALAVDLPVGGYFYSYARTVEAAAEEAQTAIDALKGYTQLTYPLAFDQEDKRQQGLSKRLNTDMAIAALRAIKAAGFIPALYSNPNWMQNHVYYEELAGYDLWLARWAAAPGYDCAIWQYTDEGRVDGIDGNVDLNRGYKAYGETELIAGEVLANVNVRVAPDVSAAPLGQLSAGTKVSICRTEGAWEKIRYDGRDAYVYGAYIAKGKAKRGYVHTANSALNLREAPDMQAKVLLTMPNGAVLEVYGAPGAWRHVRYKGVVGYAHGDYVRL